MNYFVIPFSFWRLCILLKSCIKIREKLQVSLRYKIHSSKAGEMGQQVRGLTALSQDSGFIPNTNIRWLSQPSLTLVLGIHCPLVFIGRFGKCSFPLSIHGDN